MDSRRATKLTYLRFQIRALQRREHHLQVLLGKTCDGNREEAEVELARVGRHLQAAKDALAECLRETQDQQTTSQPPRAGGE